MMQQGLYKRLLVRLMDLRVSLPEGAEREARKMQLTAACYGASLPTLARIYRDRMAARCACETDPNHTGCSAFGCRVK